MTEIQPQLQKTLNFYGKSLEMGMSQSRRHLTKAAILAFFMSWSGPSPTQGNTASSCTDTYTGAIRLMRAFYPELSGKGVVMDVQTRYPFDADGPLLSFYIQVSTTDQLERVVAAPYPNPSSADRVGQLSAHFQFDGRDDEVFSIFVNGSLVNSQKREALDKLVDEHPEWSEAQMTDALLKAGAKFVPNQKEQLLATFPFKELEPILGKIEMGPAQFTFRGNTEPPFYAVLDWSIRFWATKDGKRNEYTTSVEPFGGKLTSFGRRPLN